MLLEHPDHPGRGVRLGYCMNLHAAEDLEGVLEGMRRVTLPLAERFDAPTLREGFGVGMYLPGDLALELSTEQGEDQLESLRAFLARARLDPFTFNAFPYGGFHEEGLKERVFRPTWGSAMRSAYTLAVAQVAVRLCEDAAPNRHLSISTHTGTYGPWLSEDATEAEAERDELATNLAMAAVHLCGLERETGRRIVLSLEPEPDSLAPSTRELPAWFERIRFRARALFTAADSGEVATGEDEAILDTLLARYLGTCLDTCHVAVAYEEPERALARATSGGAPLGKLQVSSALELRDPGGDPAARALLLALAEPVYLHQVTGRLAAGLAAEAPEGLRHAPDLPALARALAAPPSDAGGGTEDWLACESWRCHFHVPVDLEQLAARAPDGSDARLGTTRALADAGLAAALAAPERWGTDELHVELETYTWDLLPDAARGTGDLVDGLEREYRHVLAQLAAAGWTPARTRANS